MNKYFVSPKDKPNIRNIDVNKKIKFSFYDLISIPQFSICGVGIINSINENNATITINLNQDFYQTSIDGSNIDLESPILIQSFYEDNNIVKFVIPIDYIWCIELLYIIP